MTINNRGLSGQPILPYVDYRSYMGADVFIDLNFLDHTGNLVQPNSVSYRIDDLTNAVPMQPLTAITWTAASATGSVGFNGTGSVAGDILTITAVTSGIILPNDTVVMAALPSGTKIINQITGSTGTTGTYHLSYPSINPITSTNVQTQSFYLYVTAVEYGVFAVGDSLANANWSATIQSLAINPNPVVLTGTLWLVAGSQFGPFAGQLTVAGKIPSSYTLQIPGSILQMTHNWQGSQICQIWLTTIWSDPVTNQPATAQGVAVVELCAIQTPYGAV